MGKVAGAGWLLLAILLVAIEGCGPGDVSALNDSQVTLSSSDFAAALQGDSLIKGPSASLPFSFNYQGKSSGAFLASWTRTGPVVTNTGSYVLSVTTFTDPATGLQVIYSQKTFPDFPNAQYWVIYFKNTSSKVLSPVSNVDAANFNVTDSSDQPFKIHYNYGIEDSTTITDFEPRYHILQTGYPFTQSPYGGSSSKAFPYYNLEKASGGGTMVAIGWSGIWQATWSNPMPGVANFLSGMRYFCAQLLPGETLRMPSFLTLNYTGNRWTGQSHWRALMRAHFSPRRNGAPVAPFLTTTAFDSTQGNFTEASVNNALAGIKASGVKIPTFWIDAGWYPLLPNEGWFDGIGDWNEDSSRLPSLNGVSGLMRLSNNMKSMGMNLLLWFEEERTTKESSVRSYLASHIPDSLVNIGDQERILVNLANPETQTYMSNYINNKIKEYGVTIYRHDMNMDQYPNWEAHDVADSNAHGKIYRQGVEESKYITGFYKHWDALLAANNPNGSTNFLIDDCAGGGRRLDFEALSRSVPLWRSDNAEVPIHEQVQEQGLAPWVPFEGGRAGFSRYSLGMRLSDLRYKMRSAFGNTALFTIPWDTYLSNASNSIWSVVRNEVNNWYKLAHIFAGDYYTLAGFEINDNGNLMSTSQAESQSVWVAWQFQLGNEGLVQAFQRSSAACPASGVKLFRLNEMNPTRVYTITNMDRPNQSYTRTGAQLSTNGIEIPCTPGIPTNIGMGIATLMHIQ